MIEISYKDNSLSRFYDKFYFKFSCCSSFGEFLIVNKLWRENRFKHGTFYDFIYSLPMYGSSGFKTLQNTLQTEYNTSIATLQLCQKWYDIKRDQDIFPYIQFDAVMDGLSTDLDMLLNDRVFSVDDPILDIIFPPNSFNDRMTIRRIRDSDKDRETVIPEIERAFAHNVGKSFTIDKKEFFIIPKTRKNIHRVKLYYRKYHLID